MATKSKYTQQQIDKLVADLITVLEQHKTPVDLSLMALGDLISNIIKNNVSSEQQRQVIVKVFNDALNHSLNVIH